MTDVIRFDPLTDRNGQILKWGRTERDRDAGLGKKMSSD